MDVVVTGCGMFCAALAVHWLVWRIRVPSRPILVLLAIAAIVGILWLVAAAKVPWFGRWAPRTLWPCLHATLFHIACWFVYIINYTGIEQDSPSFSMVKFVAMAGDVGREAAEFKPLISDNVVVQSRLQSLLTAGLVSMRGGRYVLTPKGAAWNRLFGAWRHLLGIREGG
jgi:hypothetical protein